MILKVCGITNQVDASVAIAGGANAIGFNFFARSPRYLEPSQAADIETPGARRVGVFVNESPARIAKIAAAARLDVVQLHGDEAAGDYPAELAVWKAVRVAGDIDFKPYEAVPAEALLLDGPADHLYGGAGKTFDWRLAGGLTKPIIVAGGLDASNVARAVELAHPWGVDACSRIESEPGKKDHEKMNQFLQAARAALHL